MPFQIKGRDFLAANKNAVLADDMGLGKTLMAIEAMKTLILTSGLIICPLGVRRTWVKVLSDQYPQAIVKELTTIRSIPYPKAINIINYDIAWREPIVEALKTHWPVLIADESHFLKSIEAKRTKAILGRGGVHNFCDRRWMMTGTPVLNRPIELYPILRSLCPDTLGVFRDYYRYAYRYCAAFRDAFGFNTDGASNLKELAQLLSPIMLRRMKEDVLPQLPEIRYEKIYLEPTDKLINLTKEEEIADDTTVLSIRHAVGLLKVKPAIIHIEEVLETKPKIVVFTWHKDVAHALKDRFKTKAVLFTGEEDVTEKEEAKEAFIQDPGVRIFIGQLEAAGIGIDGLQHVCDTCIFVEMYSVPGKIKQAVDRLRRIGQEKGVLAQFLVAEDSVDEKTVDSLAAKSENIKTILSEKGGATFVYCICQVCKKSKEIEELSRANGLAVCKDCKNLLEVL
jgi:SWI/SNF-related matrix-associated actin-dependent regulator 1 of chromatin subfamily A